MSFKDYLVECGVTEDIANKIVEGMPSKSYHIVGEEKLEERYNKLKDKKEQLDSDLATANKLIDDFKAKANTSEEMTKKIDEYKSQIEQLESQRALDRRESFVKLAVTKAKAKSEKAVMALLDLEKVTEKDGEFSGLEEQLKSLQESDGYLFDTGETPSTQAVAGGNRIGGNEPPTDAFAAIGAKYQ